MVNPTSTAFLLVATAFLVSKGEARDLKRNGHTHGSDLSRRSPHAAVAHQFAIDLKASAENASFDQGFADDFVHGDQMDAETEGGEVHPHSFSKRQLAPSRGNAAKCANLRIPAFESALTNLVKNNLAATGGDSWVSGTR